MQTWTWIYRWRECSKSPYLCRNVLRSASPDPRRHVHSLQTIMRSKEEKLHQVTRLVSTLLEVELDDTPISALRRRIFQFVESHRHPAETDELSNHIFAAYKMLADETRNDAEIAETCGICTAQIPWMTVDAASCTKGHRFGQCLQPWPTHPDQYSSLLSNTRGD
jgi:hypothetical protein